MLQEKSKILIRPIVSYPKVAEVGQSYLLTVDVRMEGEDMSEWPYEEEEYPITCILEAGSLFKHTTAGAREPVLLLHRFGRTYGPVRFLLTAAREPRAGQIIITLVNKFGVPIDFIFLHCEVKETVNQQIPVDVPELPGATSLFPPPIVERPPTDVQQMIEARLQLVGWVVRAYDPAQSYSSLSVETDVGGVAIRNFGGTENYVLFLSGESGPIGVIQVFPVDVSLEGLEQKVPVASILERQETLSGRALLPFVYMSTGYITRFTNDTESNARSREIFTFHQPQTLHAWLREIAPASSGKLGAPLIDQIYNMPPIRRSEINEDQREAMQRLEKSFVANRSRALLRMESGYNRTTTIIHSISRLMNFTSTRRILYLTAYSERVPVVQLAFKHYRPDPHSERRYSVERLDSGSTTISSGSVVIGDIETLYARQTGQTDSSISIVDEAHRVALESFSSDDIPLEITYNPNFPIEVFDFIFIDGWPARLYQQWSSLLRYFDAFLVGFSSVVDDTLYSFFQRDLVYNAEPASRRRQWAVLVGVNEYEDRNITNLRGSSSDANLVWQLVVHDGDETKIHLLNSVAGRTSELPTRQNIVSALQRIGGEMQPDDLLLFYFSGHGMLNKNGTEGYLLAQDSSSDTLEETALSLSQIKRIIRNIRAREKVMILDTCYVGADRVEKDEVPFVPSGEFVKRAISRERERIVILAACAQDQLSYEESWPTTGRQGIFTHFLLEALSGRADVDDKGAVTASDAYTYISNKMRGWSRQTRRRQIPTMLRSSGKEDVVLSWY